MPKAQAIYNLVTGSRAYEQPTLVYSRRDGFSWVTGSHEWHTYNPTAVGAELEARKAGLDPKAVTYVES